MNYRPYFIVIILSLSLMVPMMQASENTANLNAYIISGPHIVSPTIKVINTGNLTIHNVRITNVSVQGNVLYNNRGSLLADELGPGEISISQPNSLFIGFGLFSITITINYNEGSYITDKTNGFIIGWFFLIP